MPTDPRLDALVQHRIGLERVQTSVLRQLLPVLEEAERDVVDIIQNRLFEGGRAPSRSEVVRLEKTLVMLRKAQLEGYGELFKRMTSELRGVARHEGEFANEFYKTHFGLTQSLEIPSADMLVAAAMERPMSGRPLRAWANKMKAEHIAEVERQIRLGVIEGEGIDQIVRRLRGTEAYKGRDGIFVKHHNSAEALVRTAVNHISNTAHANFLKGNPKIFKQYQWISVLDNRCVHPNTMVATPNGERAIQDILPGDVVIGGSGKPRRVASKITKRVDGLCRVHFSNGRTVVCSRDHLFLRGDQKWVEAEALEPGTELAQVQYVDGNPDYNRPGVGDVLKLQRSNSKARNAKAKRRPR